MIDLGGAVEQVEGHSLDAQGRQSPAVNTVVASDTLLMVDPPDLPQGRFEIIVRNVDHFPAVPRESPLMPPQTDITYFDFQPSDITVTGITPSSVVEGTSARQSARASISRSLWVAIGVMRSRAVPRGTDGWRIPWA